MTQEEIDIIVNQVMDRINAPVDMPIEVLDGATLPFYAHPTDAGMDIRANADCTIYPGQTVIIPTGLKIAIPNGYEVQVRPRSGLSAKTPIQVALGTIDTGYRSEMGVITHNDSPIGSNEDCTIEDRHKMGIYHIHKGDRIAQMILNKITTINLCRCEDINIYASDRGSVSGFGSSGVK